MLLALTNSHPLPFTLAYTLPCASPLPHHLLTTTCPHECRMALLCDGMLINSSLEQLQLVRTQMSDVGCFHLMQVRAEFTMLG